MRNGDRPSRSRSKVHSFEIAVDPDVDLHHLEGLCIVHSPRLDIEGLERVSVLVCCFHLDKLSSCIERNIAY